MLKLHFTDRAEHHLEEVAQWWADNRPKARRQVLEEVEAATARLCELPASGSPYGNIRGRKVRRGRVGKTPYYLYYVADAETVTILAVWSAMRGAEPEL